MTTNAQKELLELIKGKKVVCAKLLFNPTFFEDNEQELILKVGYTLQEFADFVEELDFNYDSGYGTQHLHGVVLLENGEWLERGEYDGSEWWNLKSYPEIPEECQSNERENESEHKNNPNPSE